MLILRHFWPERSVIYQVHSHHINVLVCPCAVQKSDVLFPTKNIASRNRQSGYGNFLLCMSRWQLASSDTRSGRGRLLQALPRDSTPSVDSACYRRHRLQQFGWSLEALCRVFLQQDLQENNDRLRHVVQLSNHQRCMQVLVHHLSGRTSEWRPARHHLPEHHAQRVEVRADFHANSGELLWTSELRCPSKNSGN